METVDINEEKKDEMRKNFNKRQEREKKQKVGKNKDHKIKRYK